jgi:hypothetical protein
MIVQCLRSLTEFVLMFAIANVFGSCARFWNRLSPFLPSIALPPSQNNKKQMTHAAPVKISYHQSRGCYVQRSKYGCYPGGRIRSLL